MKEHHPLSRAAKGLAAVALLLLLFSSYYLTTSPAFLSLLSPYHGSRVDRKIPLFRLYDTNRSLLSEDHWTGAFHYIFFGYVTCGTVCPVTMERLRELSRLEGMEEVRFAFISVDPLRDTPERLERYISSYGSGFRGYYPQDQKEALRAASFFKGVVSYTRYGDSSYAGDDIGHTGFLYLVDPAGHLRLIYPDREIRPEVMAEDVRLFRRNWSEEREQRERGQAEPE